MYPALLGSGSPTCCRISVLLKDPINPDILKKAVADIAPHFPYFKHFLGRGLFWHFLQETEKTPLVIQDSGHICRDFYGTKDEKLLLRVLYEGYRISVEVSHILTDGHGALEYLKHLTEHYLICAGILRRKCLPPTDFSSEEFIEDSYQRYFIKDIPHAEQPGKAFQPGAWSLPNGQFRLICGEIDAEALQRESKKLGITITQYFATAYLWSLYCLSKNEKTRPVQSIRLIIPVNLRNLYPSKTMRNFFAPILCEILPFLGEYKWEEISEELKLQMTREIKPRFINLQIARNVSITNNLFIRLIPLALKVPIQRFIFINQGIRTASGILSNLGKVALPEEIEEQIVNFEFINSPSHVMKTTAGVVGYKDKVLVTFCNTTADTSVEREFFTALSKNGIRTKIYTNYQKEQ
jgi:NRPS condensation-like uncharacterized protein